MKILSVLRFAGPVDLRNVRRDDFLLWVGIGPFLLALLFRFGVPPLAGLLDRELGFDLAPYHGLLMSFFVLMAPSMIGWVTGFLLLDERDGGVLTALLVTPMPFAAYLLYRIGAPLLLGFVMTVAVYPLAGLAPLPLPDLIAISLVASLTGPAMALFLAAFAENKVAGFALVKVLNTLTMIPIAAWFLRSPWQLAAGLVPTYWPMKMVWLAMEGRGFLLHGLAGLAVYGVAMALLLKHFQTRIYS
jgi:fluoroquinolone transport system permease protein